MEETISINSQVDPNLQATPQSCGNSACGCGPESSPIDDGLNDESLRRVQACLIACEGISTDDLEAGIIQEMRQTLRDVIPLLQNLRRNCA